MLPLKDDTPRVTTPYITWVLLALNTIVFLFELSIDHHGEGALSQFVNVFGVVPARLTVVLFNHGYVPWNLVGDLGTRYVPTMAAILPLFTSMFLHASWFHLIFNMWALWIFGDNIEDYLGPLALPGVLPAVRHRPRRCCTRRSILAQPSQAWAPAGQLPA